MSSIDRSRPEADVQTCTESLTEVLAARRPDADTAQLARTLLWYETAGREVVGLTPDCSRAYYYQTASETLVTVSFDERTIGRADDDAFCRHLRDVEPWVRQHATELAWTHPRYRSRDR